MLFVRQTPSAALGMCPSPSRGSVCAHPPGDLCAASGSHAAPLTSNLQPRCERIRFAFNGQRHFFSLHDLKDDHFAQGLLRYHST